MAETVESIVKSFIIDNFRFGDTSFEIAADASLIENDVVDSTGVLELVAFLEERFAVTVGDADIVPANLDSLARIAAFVARKTGGLAAAA
ncbi:MAG: acyl carrier protein [Siculibacillus sp.]